MALFGECEWCGQTDALRFKPGGSDDQTRPSICNDCYYREEQRLEEMRQENPAEILYGPTTEPDQDVDGE